MIKAVNAIALNNNSSWIIASIGIANQRETIIAWNAVTGKPYYNAIVWDDTRTAGIVKDINIATAAAAAAATTKNGYDGDGVKNKVDVLREKTGLPLSR